MKPASIPWNLPGWQSEVHDWIDTQLARHALQRTGEITQPHIRPWSTVLGVPTDAGRLYFKATAPYLSYEPALTAYLARLRPDISPDLLAVDIPRGWMLMRESGIALRTFIKTEHSLARWREIMPLYAGLQKEMPPRVDEILKLGVLDRRLETLPAQFERLVADKAALLVGQPDSLTEEEYQRLTVSVAGFERQCAELAAFGLPTTLHHDDFHDGNLFVQDERVIFTDWGESAVTHPFFTLVVMLRGAENSLQLAPDSPELAQMRAWYLSQWTDYAPLAELQSVVRLAERLGLVNRALTWQRVISNLPDELKPEYALAVPSYLQEFINQ
ncbi:MAG: phosphotransferase [Chloroflexi bacterium]|nr:phosphotransferase [Chloroflexota bacterium]